MYIQQNTHTHTHTHTHTLDEFRGHWPCSQLLNITVVSRASAHSQVSAHIPNFKGSLLQLPYKHMEFVSRVSTHVGRNRELYLLISARGRLPGTLRYSIFNWLNSISSHTTMVCFKGIVSLYRL